MSEFLQIIGAAALAVFACAVVSGVCVAIYEWWQEAAARKQKLHDMFDQQRDIIARLNRIEEKLSARELGV